MVITGQHGRNPKSGILHHATRVEKKNRHIEREQNVRNDPSRVYVQYIHEAFLELYTGSKVKQSKAK